MRRFQNRQLATLIATGVAVMGLAVTALWLHRDHPPPALEFVGTQTCATCHQEASANWQQSDHRHAMEVATAQTVLGNFNNATFDYFGTQSRFFTRDGQYFVETDNARGELETFRLAYTFGHFPLQQYLVEFPDGRMQALSISWDSRPAAAGGQRWYHLYPDAKVAHDDALHWTGAFQNWNSRCAACHSTELVRNYSRQTNRYDTQWREINVGCEACHGPGSRHLAWAKGQPALSNKGLTTQVSRIWTPAGGERHIPLQRDAAMSGQLQVCGGCHARRAELQPPDVSADFHDNYSLSPLLEGRYFADGQMREEVYEVGSFLQSRMQQNHVSCTNCHEPHSSKLRVAGNGLCLQCHEPRKFQTQAHFFHREESAGAQCVNCHMPQQTYMGVDARRDHSFRVPDPMASVNFGVPNACTQCHTNRDDRWAATAITRLTGRTEPKYPQTALLTAARRGDPAALPDLLAFAQDNSRPAILRSIALLESGRFSSPLQLDAVRAALAATDPLIRIGAASALGPIDASQRLALLRPVLEDQSKAVRHIVARQLIDVPLARVPQDVRAALGKLFDEYQQTLLHNADMPESMSDLGLFHAAQGNLAAAQEALQHARTLAPRYLPAMLNLADLHRARDRDDLGETLLREALASYPESGDVRHLLGLLYVRTGRTAQAVAMFQSAARLAPDNARYALVYALSLIETGSRKPGIAALEAAIRRFPHDTELRQALDSLRSDQH